MSETIGLVLAGGQSSRMGTNKALLEWQGLPMYKVMSETLAQSGVDKVLVSASNLPVDNRIPDLIPGKGPMSGLHAVVEQCKNGDRVLVSPVDMPLLPVAACHQLLACEGDVPACFTDFTLPMLLPVNDDLREYVGRSINSQNPRDYSLWRLHRNLNGNTVPLSEKMTSFFLNTNTPQEWQSACEMKSAAEQPAEDLMAKPPQVAELEM